jgi:hypothetical protein
MSTIRSKDRASLCSFTFADSRKCLSPRFKNHAHLCYFHALKESQANASVTIGNKILNRFSGSYLSACDLTNALGQVFSGVAQGSIKRKTAATLAYLGQTMVNSIQIAQAEYINAFSADHWRDTIHSSVTSNSPDNDSTQDDSVEEATAEDNAGKEGIPEPVATTSAK